MSESPQISEFSIRGLHGQRNVTIPFEGPVKILVAENGFGKTTVLNSMHALISGNFAKLRSTEFESVSLRFKSGQSVMLKKTDIVLDPARMAKSGMFNHLKGVLGASERVFELLDRQKSIPPSIFRRSSLVRSAARKAQVPSDHLMSWLDSLSREMASLGPTTEQLGLVTESIRKEFSYDILYLPTYRRIEEDLKYLGDSDDHVLDQDVMQFGMHDVLARIKELTGEIKSSSMQWFAKVNGQMLGQLIEAKPLDDEMKVSLNDKDALRIVLHRMGENIPEKHRDHILKLIETGEINSDHDELAYFLANLVKVYEQQKKNDNAIKKFTETSNKYLVDKKVVYDETAVDIVIRRTKNDQIVDLSTLSSGEKQIISLFSKLFLGQYEDVAIFFDEPELSLSIEWQKQLLPHILEAGICKFLFCTTHSPFIFQNNLAICTSGLDRYIEEL